MKYFNADHLKYLYLENREQLAVWSLLVLPAVAMSGSLVYLGYDSTHKALGPVAAGAMALVMVVLAIYAFSESFPIMPAQQLELKLRYRRLVGWAYLALSMAMGAFFYTMLLGVWQQEPAAGIQYLPELLSAVGVGGGLVISSLLISVHKLPTEVHRNIVESEQVEQFNQHIEDTRAWFGKAMTYLVKRCVIDKHFSADEDRNLRKVAAKIEIDLASIEQGLLKDLTSFTDRTR